MPLLVPVHVGCYATGRRRRFGMTILMFSALVSVASLVAGFLGALTGLGGGVVIVPC